MDEAAEQVRLDGEQIAVAAGVMQDGLDAGVLLNLDAEALRAHAGRGARRVGDVDGMHAKLREHAGSLDLFGAIDAARGNNLHQGDKAALFDQGANAGARTQRRGWGFGGD